MPVPMQRSLRAQRLSLLGAMTGPLVASFLALSPWQPARAADVPVAVEVAKQENRPSALVDPARSIGTTFRPIAAFDLGEEIPALAGVVMRASILTISAGGQLALHDHSARPAFSWVLEGNPVEYRSDRNDPVVHHPGSITREIGMSHYWQNEGDTVARLLVVDLIPEEQMAGLALDRAKRRAEDPDFVGAAEPVGATVEVQGQISLSEAFPHLSETQNWMLRARRIDLRPGAYSHLHRHENAPSLTFIAEGQVREHRNDRSDPSIYQQGEIAIDRAGMAHWWEVKGEESAVFLVAEIVSKGF